MAKRVFPEDPAKQEKLAKRVMGGQYDKNGDIRFTQTLLKGHALTGNGVVFETDFSYTALVHGLTSRAEEFDTPLSTMGDTAAGARFVNVSQMYDAVHHMVLGSTAQEGVRYVDREPGLTTGVTIRDKQRIRDVSFDLYVGTAWVRAQYLILSFP